jgi:hypothetical protein
LLQRACAKARCSFAHEGSHDTTKTPPLPLQARQAWVEELQPAFSALRSVRAALLRRLCKALLSLTHM